MSRNQNNVESDILNLELLMKEKLNELQWKSKTLEETQRELLQARQELLNKDIELEDHKRKINDLKMKLTTSSQVIEWLEKEKSKHVNERLQLQVNCDTALKERESLLNQVHAAKLENMTLKLTVQKLTETVSTHESSKKTVEASLLEVQERFSQLKKTIESNMMKLEKEQKLLLKSLESTEKLNKRLQTVGLCTHAIYTKKNQEIEELRKELLLKSNTNNLSQQYNLNKDTHNHNKSNAKAVLEGIHVDIEKDCEMDKEFEDLLALLEN